MRDSRQSVLSIFRYGQEGRSIVEWVFGRTGKAGDRPRWGSFAAVTTRHAFGMRHCAQSTFSKRHWNAGILVSREEASSTYAIRETITGDHKNVRHLRLRSLIDLAPETTLPIDAEASGASTSLAN